MHYSERSKSANEVDAKLAGKFVHARITANLDIVSAARGLGINLNEYCSYERGDIRVPAQAIATMSRLTNKPIGWFFDVEKVEQRGSVLKIDAHLPHPTIPTRIAALVTRMRRTQNE